MRQSWRAFFETISSSSDTGFPLSRSAICDSYLIALSVFARTLLGIVNPICFAVFKLMKSSNFMGCSTGRSPGLAPLRILSTYVATRR
jgi:hypothetical protein